MAGMFDDLEKETQAAPINAPKAGLFDDLIQATTQPEVKAPKVGMFDDLKNSGSPQTNTTPQPTVSNGLAQTKVPNNTSPVGRSETLLESLTPSPIPEKDPTKLMEYMGLDPKNPKHVAIAKQMQVGSLEHTINQTLKQTGDFIAKWTGLERSSQFFTDKAEEAIVPGSPLKTIVKGAPAVAGATLADLGRGAIPSSLMDYGLMFAFGGAEKLDESLAMGYKNVAKTAPKATALTIQAMMDVADPVVRANLLKKSAPVLLGRTVAEEVVGLTPGKIGIHPPDAVVSKVLGDLGEQGLQIFRRGLESFPDKELSLFNGTKFANEVKKLLVKAEGKPEMFQELVANFTPAQQRLITRRGLGMVDFQPGQTFSYTPDLYELQDTTIEHLPKKLWDIHESNNLGIRLENSGDIFRELTGREYPDTGYIGEKTTKIRNALSKPDMKAEMPAESKALMNEIANKFSAIDLTGKPKVLIAARDLNVALARQDFKAVEKLLPVLEKLDPKTLSAKGVSEADILIGKQKLTSAIRELNQPFELTPDQQDVARSLAIQDNLKNVTETIATKGASQPTPNLDQVEAALASRAPRSNPIQTIQESVGKLYSDAHGMLEFEPHLKKYPAFRQDLESLQSYSMQASRESTALVGATLEGLSTKEEFETFRKLIIMNDWKEALETGSTTITGKLTKEQVNLAIANYGAKAPASVLEAMERHYDIVRAFGQDLVRRGYLEEDMLNDKYFHHKVIKYLEDDIEGDAGAIGNKPVGGVFRSYVLGRTENAAAIDTDYIRVMHRLYTKVKIDNQMEDFIRAQAAKFDHTPNLSDEARLATFGESGSPRVSQRYVIDGKHYIGYRYFPKNAIYGTTRSAEKIITDALESSLDPAELEQRLSGVNQRLELQRVHLLPEEVADSLKRLTQPQQLAHIYDLIRHSTRMWKRVTLAGAGLPWQAANFTGSLEALYREGDISAIMHIPESLVRLGKAQLKPDELEPMIQRAIDAHLINPPGQGLMPQDAPELLRFMDNPTRFVEALKSPLKIYDSLTQASVGSPKFAKLMVDSARIQRGEAVVTKTFGPELAGLTAEQQVTQVNRLTLVEFSVNNPKFNTFFRDALFPFASFYYNNTKSWAKYLARNPADAVVKFGTPYAAMQYWNWSRFPDVEKGMEPFRRYQPHVITGRIDDKGKHVVITYSSIGQEALRWVAADKLLYRTAQVANGELSMADAASDQLSDTLKAPAEMGWNLLNPLASAMVEVGVNRKKPAAGGGQIVPHNLEGTRQGLALQHEHLLRNLVTPLSTYYRTEAKEEASPADPMLRFLKYGPFDVERAAGIKHVDLNAAERTLRGSRGEEGRVLNNQNFADLEDAYVKSQVGGTGEEYSDALDRLKSKIYLPPGRDLASYLKTPRVQIRILKEKLQRVRSEGERSILISEIQELKDGQSLKSVKGAPRQIRGYQFDGSTAE